MNEVPQNFQKLMGAIEGVVKILGSFSSDERKQIIQGVGVILRDQLAENVQAGIQKTEFGETHLLAKPQLWMKQNGVSSEQLAQVFDISAGEATVIAGEVAGKNSAEKVIKAYVLTGLGALLANGEAEFLDKDARELCETLGCYDGSNHSRYLKEKGKYFIGSKEKSWRLTAPGLKYGALLVKELTD